MGRLRHAAAVLAVVVLALAGCSDDGPDAGADGDAGGDEGAGAIPGHATTSTFAAGGLDIEVPEGFTAIPLPSAGFGLAVPEGWEATVLTDAALDRLEALQVSPGFLDAARNAAGSGAVLYAAGVDGQGRVADLKLMRIPQPAAPGPAEVEAVARQALAAAPAGAELELRPDDAHPSARVTFRVGDGTVEAVGTQWLVAGPDAVFSLVVTSEDPDVHDELAADVAGSLTFA
ncbi:MAG: hypothetical protein AB7L84_13370 [Acidimicrobiia bacterium]